MDKKDKMRIYIDVTNSVKQNASDVTVKVDNGDVRMNWEGFYMSFGDVDEAEKIFRKALKVIQDSKFSDSKNSLWSTPKDKQ